MCIFFLITKEYHNSNLAHKLFVLIAHFNLCHNNQKIVTSMMRGRIFCNGSIFGSSVRLAIITIIILYLGNVTDGKKLISHIPNSKVNAFKISGSLRYLTKAVFTKAIVGGTVWLFYQFVKNNMSVKNYCLDSFL